MSRIYPQLSCALIGALAASICAADDGARDESGFLLYAGVEANDADSRRVDVGGAWQIRSTTTLDLSGSRTATDLSEGSLASTAGSARLTHDFGRIGLGAGARTAEDDGVSTTVGWFATAFVDVADARMSLNVESRESQLEPTTFTSNGAAFGLADETVSGTSRCDVDSIGYQLRLSLARPRWSFSASALTYDYRAYECDIALSSAENGGTQRPGNPAGRNPVRVQLPSVAERFAANALNRATGYSSRLTERDAALLDSSFMMGASISMSTRLTAGTELYHDTEQFSDNTSNTGLMFVEWLLSPAWATELSVGYTRADLVESTTFLGLRVSTTF